MAVDLSPQASVNLERELADLEGMRVRLRRQFPQLRRFTGREVILQYGRQEEKELSRVTDRIARIRLALLSRGVARRRQPRRIRRKSSTPVASKAKFTHSPDFRTVTLNGETYHLTSRGAQATQILHDAREQGTPELGTHYILEQLGTKNSRLRDTFKRSHAWGKLIVAGERRGTVRLNLPEPFYCPSCRQRPTSDHSSQ